MAAVQNEGKSESARLEFRVLRTTVRRNWPRGDLYLEVRCGGRAGHCSRQVSTKPPIATRLFERTGADGAIHPMSSRARPARPGEPKTTGFSGVQTGRYDSHEPMETRSP